MLLLAVLHSGLVLHGRMGNTVPHRSSNNIVMEYDVCANRMGNMVP